MKAPICALLSGVAALVLAAPAFAPERPLAARAGQLQGAAPGQLQVRPARLVRCVESARAQYVRPRRFRPGGEQGQGRPGHPRVPSLQRRVGSPLRQEAGREQGRPAHRPDRLLPSRRHAADHDHALSHGVRDPEGPGGDPARDLQPGAPRLHRRPPASRARRPRPHLHGPLDRPLGRRHAGGRHRGHEGRHRLRRLGRAPFGQGARDRAHPPHLATARSRT